MKPFARINLSSVALRRGILVPSLVLIVLWSTKGRAEIQTWDCGAITNTVTATLDTDTGVFNISGTGTMKDYVWKDPWYVPVPRDPVPWAPSRKSVKSVVIGPGVASIGESAFCHCEALTSVRIPDSVTSIGDGAFFACFALSSLTIPSNVTSIGKGAFNYCVSMSSVTIPDGITTLPNNVFDGCRMLTAIDIPASVTNIGEHAFARCYALTEVTIPAGVAFIDSYAFYDCKALADVYCWPDQAKLTWGEYAWIDFMREGIKTRCHVNAEHLDAYKTKFTGNVNVVFIGDLSDRTIIIPCARVEILSRKERKGYKERNRA